MKKIRCSLAAIALVASLSGPLLQGMGAGSMANAASSLHASSVSAPFVVGKSTKLVAFNRYPPCPVPGASDC
jgi:hypothetical protein